jgi:hypothetical protein
MNNLFKKRFAIFICCVGIIIFFLLASKEYFVSEDKLMPDIGNIKAIPTNLPGDQDTPKCPENANLVDYCNVFEGCCQSSDNPNCKCRHPLVKYCNDEYSKCMKSTDGFYDDYDQTLKEEKCRGQLKMCCQPYSKIPDGGSGKIIAKSEKQGKNISLAPSSKFCTSTNSKMEDCSQMCITDKNCAAFAIDALGTCNMYSEFNPQSPVFGGSGSNISKNIPGSEAVNNMKGNYGIYKVNRS